MSYQVLARKYRPQKFSEVIGQEHITRTLQNAVLEGRLHHAYLFTGIRGIGKTTLARILSKVLSCQQFDSPCSLTAQQSAGADSPEPCNECQSCKDITAGISIDVQEIDGASNTGVDDVREIRERVKFLPAAGKYKIYIIDEVHMLSTAAFNALLKTLEEPPAHVIFIFATTEAHKIPATILSRCQRYDFRRISSQRVIETLKSIAKTEGVEPDEKCLEIIASEAEGSMRDAESLFDQAIAYAGKKLTYDSLKKLFGFLDRSQINAATRAIVERNADAVLKVADDLFNSGENLNRFVFELLGRFHALLILKTCVDVPSGKILDVDILKELALKVTIEECQQWFNALYRSAEEISRAKFPKVLLDITLINMTQVRPVRSVDELLERVEALSLDSPSSLGARQAMPTLPTGQAGGRDGFRSPPSPCGRELEGGGEGNSTKWPVFLEWLKLNKPQVASFLDASSGGSLNDSKLVIKFATPSFASDRLMETDRKAFLEKLASDFFKKAIKIDVDFDKREETAADAKKKNREETAAKHRELTEEALKHEVVREAANIFGAEIKEIKIK